MFVEVVGGTSRVREGENLKALSVRVDDRASLASALGSLGTVDGDHVWLDIAQLRSGAEASLPADAVDGAERADRRLQARSIGDAHRQRLQVLALAHPAGSIHDLDVHVHSSAGCPR